MKGKLYLLNVNNMYAPEIAHIKNKLFIVRSCKNPSYYKSRGWTIAPELSPSPALFIRYLAFKKALNWNMNTFNNIYVPEFKKQMKIDLAMIKGLNDVLGILSMGYDVAFMCYCDGIKCHRFILGDAYAERGYEVIKL